MSWLKLAYQTGRLAYELVHELYTEKKHAEREKRRLREQDAVVEGKIAAKARSCAGHENEERCK